MNILGNYAVVGTGITATSTANANLTASGTIAFLGLGTTGCISIGANSLLSTSSCGGAFTTTTITVGVTTLSQTAYTIATSGITGLTISGSGSTITFTIATSTGSQAGFLSSADWTTFNNKESALTFNAPLSRSVNTISLLTTGNLLLSGSALTTVQDIYTTSTVQFATTTLSALTVTGTSTIGSSTVRGFLEVVGTFFADTWDSYSGAASLSVLQSANLQGGATISGQTTTTNLKFTTATGTTLYFSDATKQTTNFRSFGFNVTNATTSATATTTIQRLVYQSITVTQFDCFTNGATSTLTLDIRSSSTPDTAGTSMGNAVTCDSDGFTTSTFSNANVNANQILNFSITGLVNSTTTIRATVKFKEQ